MGNQIYEHFARVSFSLSELDVSRIEKVVDVLETARRRNKTVWLVGNGGSASTAAHFANDLEKMCKIRTVCIPSNIPTVLAYGNDEGWENMFALAMHSFGHEDVLIAISCSGASRNVLRAVLRADMNKGHVIGLTGPGIVTNSLLYKAEIVVVVQDSDIKVQEDAHLAICHAIAGVLKK